MIARLRALRWPLLRTVDYTGICTSVSAAQLLTAAATVCSDQIRELTFNTRGTVRPHVTLSSVCLFESVVTLDCDNRFTITVNVFPLYRALFCDVGYRCEQLLAMEL